MRMITFSGFKFPSCQCEGPRSVGTNNTDIIPCHKLENASLHRDVKCSTQDEKPDEHKQVMKTASFRV